MHEERKKAIEIPSSLGLFFPKELGSPWGPKA